jgi:HEAT repeat protein
MRKRLWLAALGAALAAAALWKVTLTPEYLCATGDSNAKYNVIVSLKRKARWRARLILRRLVRDPDCGIRVASLACIGMLDLKGLAPAVRGVIEEDEDVLVRAQAIEVLAKIDPSAATPIVRKGLGDPRPDIRIGSLLAVGQGVEVPPDRLLSMLKEEDSRVREAALDVVSRLRLREAVPILAEDLEKRELFDLGQIHDALQRITGVNRGISKDAWLEWYDR